MEFTKEEKKALEFFKKHIFPYENKNGDIEFLLNEVIVNLIDKQQKEIKKEKNRIMELAELLDKQENEIKFLKGELEIQEGCHISKDEIKSIIDNFRKVKSEILSTENALGRASITYDIVRNDYCEKMLNQLLEEKINE